MCKLNRTIAVEHLFSLYERARGDVGIACIYLSYQEAQCLDNLLLSIIRQLLQCRQVISETVIRAHEYCQSGKTRPSKVHILDMLKFEIDNFADTFIVVDALDECPHGVRIAFLDELEKLHPKIHLLVTSRYFEIIADRLEGSVTLEISAHSEDVRAFIKAQIEDPENYRLKEFVKLQPKLQKEIVDAVIATANGM